jgi:hypothetical protein
MTSGNFRRILELYGPIQQLRELAWLKETPCDQVAVMLHPRAFIGGWHALAHATTRRRQPVPMLNSDRCSIFTM